MDKITKKQRSRNMAAIGTRAIRQRRLPFQNFSERTKLQGGAGIAAVLPALPILFFQKARRRFLLTDVFGTDVPNAKQILKQMPSIGKQKSPTIRNGIRKSKNNLFARAGRYCGFGNMR